MTGQEPLDLRLAAPRGRERGEQIGAFIEREGPKSRREIIERLGLKTSTATYWLRRLRREGRLEETEPLRSPQQRYRLAE